MTKAHNYTLAHMSPKELQILDHLQGKVERKKKDGRKVYAHLEEILSNPHLRESIHKRAMHHKSRERHSEGESVGEHNLPSLEEVMKKYNLSREDAADVIKSVRAKLHGGSGHGLESDGRHGDTEMAYLGPQTHHLFDLMAGKKTRNPIDGHPEYFSIQGALGGLWDTIKGGAGKAWEGVKQHAPGVMGQVAKAAMPAVTKWAGQKFGHLGGGMGGKLIKNLGGQAQNYMNKNFQSDNANVKGLGRGIGSALGAGLGGKSLKESMGYGMQQGARSLGKEHHLGDALVAAGKDMESGKSYQQALGDGMKAGSRHYGKGAMGSMMGSMGDSMSKGQGIGEGLQKAAGVGYKKMGGFGGVANMGKAAYQGRNQPGGAMQAAAQQGAHQFNRGADQMHKARQAPNEAVFDGDAMQDMFG